MKFLAWSKLCWPQIKRWQKNVGQQFWGVTHFWNKTWGVEHCWDKNVGGSKMLEQQFGGWKKCWDTNFRAQTLFGQKYGVYNLRLNFSMGLFFGGEEGEIFVGQQFKSKSKIFFDKHYGGQKFHAIFSICVRSPHPPPSFIRKI